MRYRYDPSPSFSPPQLTPTRLLRIVTIRSRTHADYVVPAREVATGRRRVASQGTHAPLSRPLRIHSRFTPLTRKPSSRASTLRLLLPRSAPRAPPHTLARVLQQDNGAPLQNIPDASHASAANSFPSIFSNARFGRYVATRFLADANLHGHRPTVTISPSDSRSFA